MSPDDAAWLGKMTAGAILAGINMMIMLGALHSMGYRIVKEEKKGKSK